MMKKLKYLVIHCTDTPPGRKVTAGEIWQWHTAPKPRGNGWSKVGYTDMIHIDGSLENLTPFDQDDNVEAWELTYGARGINSISRHIVYVGGKSKNLREAEDTRTAEQHDALRIYCLYTILRHPDILIAGHNQFSTKACPSFNVPCFLQEIGIPEKNIYRE